MCCIKKMTVHSYTSDVRSYNTVFASSSAQHSCTIITGVLTNFYAGSSTIAPVTLSAHHPKYCVCVFIAYSLTTQCKFQGWIQDLK